MPLDNDDLLDNFEPFGPTTPHDPSVRDQMKVDGLSFPRIATILRRLAIEKDVHKMRLWYAGTRYCVATLLRDPVSVEKMREMNQAVMQVGREEFSENTVDTYAVGLEQAAAPMFSRYGAETIFEQPL